MDVWIICPNARLIDGLSNRGLISHKFGCTTECIGNNGKVVRILMSCLRSETIENLINCVLSELSFQRIYLIDTCIGNKKNKIFSRRLITDVLVESAIFCGNTLDYRRMPCGYRSAHVNRYDDFKANVISSSRDWSDESIFEYALSYDAKIGILDKHSYEFYKVMNSKRTMVPFISVLGLCRFMGEAVNLDRALRAIQIAFLRVINDIAEKVRGRGSDQRMSVEVVPRTVVKDTSRGFKDKEDSTLECKICFDHKIDSVFLPCGHAVCCQDCAKRHISNGRGRSARCVTCNQNIYNVNNLYLS